MSALLSGTSPTGVETFWIASSAVYGILKTPATVKSSTGSSSLIGSGKLSQGLSRIPRAAYAHKLITLADGTGEPSVGAPFGPVTAFSRTPLFFLDAIFTPLAPGPPIGYLNASGARNFARDGSFSQVVTSR